MTVLLLTDTTAAVGRATQETTARLGVRVLILLLLLLLVCFCGAEDGAQAPCVPGKCSTTELHLLAPGSNSCVALYRSPKSLLSLDSRFLCV